MKPDLHEQTQQLIATGEFDSLQGELRARVYEHFAGCAKCLSFAELVGGISASLHAVNIAAGVALVDKTRLRLRHRAAELERQRHRLWMFTLSICMVSLTATLSTPLLLGGFAWVGRWLHLSNVVWQAGFMLFWIVPALLASVLLAACGAHWNDQSTARQ